VENVILAIVFFTAAFICLAIEAFVLPALSALLFGLGIWIISKTRFGRRFVQGESLKGAVSSIGRDHTDIVGKEGAALSDLHPVGSAMVEGKKLDVITNGIFIKKGSRLRVIEASGPRIVVEEIKG
jgi:membrane-bound serine protease (ClpP class)